MTGGMSGRRAGLARIISVPPVPDYHARLFLGSPPPTVPPVLDRSLFTPASGARSGTTRPGHR
ncbi:hypothetical protein [Corynebacterium provencense]|jgi:hypothetical protein|uniref:Uncharacterized protein n=1 Tax=Corynebacterium provencense TaxID=1737425 RepID=A0A2Z3YR74_9CORY|nr:hypothetical protein [Corynebacterium provencense]AWT25550.1 hypothetical protein Csp1_07410 [Corynebacterium provencense]MCI1256420.1 hypothetical protein [Corynebacterium provencense]